MNTQHGQRAARRIGLRDGRMRRGHSVAARALGAWLAVSGASCSDPGEIMLVVQTDLNAEKDIDKIQIEVRTGDGEVALRGEYGIETGDLKLPGTLGIRSSRDLEQPLTISVSGELDGAVRIVREVRTTLPESGTVMLRAPLQWLCNRALLVGSAECNDNGSTCIAGSCASSGITASTLPSYAATDVFGGGSGSGVDGECFDVVQCFDGAKDVDILKEGDPPCSIPGSSSDRLNIALRTEGDGFCGSSGCFVPLDAESDIGWREVSGSDGPRIQLPAAVCPHRLTGKVLGVAMSTKCVAKSERTPTCGAWSQAGKWSAPDPSVPVVLAAGQNHPSSIAIDGSRVYWTNAGAEAASGSVKMVSLEGGAPREIAFNQDFPSGIAVDGDVDVRRAHWINEGTGAVMRARLDGKYERLSLEGLGARGNLELHGGSLYFGTVDNLIVHFSPASGILSSVTIEEEAPVSIATDATGANVYWTFRGSSLNEGGLKRAPASGDEPSKTLISMQQNPLAITVDGEHIYWVNAGSLSVSADGSVVRDGSILRVKIAGGDPELLADEQAVPYAIAIDTGHVYWTNLGDGCVMRAPKSGGEDAVCLATGQSNPVAIAVDDDGDFVYWANAGTAAKSFSDGSIMRVSTE